jgi:hypothetical protein
MKKEIGQRRFGFALRFRLGDVEVGVELHNHTAGAFGASLHLYAHLPRPVGMNQLTFSVAEPHHGTYDRGWSNREPSTYYRPGYLGAKLIVRNRVRFDGRHTVHDQQFREMAN